MPVGDSVTLFLGIDSTGATRGAREFEDAVGRTKRAAGGAADKVDDLSGAITRIDPPALSAAASLGKMQAAVAGFAGGIAASLVDQLAGSMVNLAKESVEVADRYQQLDSRLALVLDSTNSVADAHQRLFQVAQQTGQSFEGTAGLFQKLAMSSRDLGMSYEELIALTTTINQALVIGGASASEASSGLQQLSQSFASGVLRGDEFNSVMENFPPLAMAIARGLGLTLGELRNMAEQGELSATTVARAIQSQSGNIANDYSKMGTTVSQASTQLQNAWQELSVEANKAAGVNENLVIVLQRLTELVQSDGLRQGLSVLGTAFSSFYGVVGDGLNLLSTYGKLVNSITGSQAKVQAPEAPALAQPKPLAAHQLIKGWVQDAQKQRAEEEELAKISRIPKPSARPTSGIGYKMIELDMPKKSGGGARSGKSAATRDAETDAREAERLIDSVTKSYLSATDQRIEIINRERDAQLEAIDKISLSAAQKDDLRVKVAQTASAQIAEIAQKEVADQARKQETVLKSLAKYEEENLAAHGRVSDAVVRQREEEIREINALPGASDEQKAQARVLVEDTASQRIIEIRRREAEEIRSLEEENLQTRAGYAFGDERKQLQKRLLEMQRDSQLADIQASKMSDEMKAQATAVKSDTFAQRIAVIDPTPWEQASRTLQQFGEGLTGVEGMTQGVIQGISSIGATATAAFADAIVSGESFSDVLDSLAMSLEKMIIQMTLQMALQQALGAGASALGAWMAPTPAAGTGAGAGAAPAGGSGWAWAKGGAFDEGTGLRSGVYSQPTYFRAGAPELRAPEAQGLTRPLASYDTAFAKGGVFDLAMARLSAVGTAGQSGSAQPTSQSIPTTSPRTEIVNKIIDRPTYIPMSEPGLTKMAAGRGLMGEAGPEAVLPLTRTPTGQLGVATSGGGGGSTVNITVNNNSKANVQTESSDDPNGNRNIVLTIADEVEGIISSRMARSGSRVNRSVQSVGAVVAR